MLSRDRLKASSPEVNPDAKLMNLKLLKIYLVSCSEADFLYRTVA